VPSVEGEITEEDRSAAKKCADRLLGKRKDPLSYASREERQSEMRKQIQADVAVNEEAKQGSSLDEALNNGVDPSFYGNLFHLLDRDKPRFSAWGIPPIATTQE
jgi:hypothetical protein